MSWEVMFDSDLDQFVTNLHAIHDQQIIRNFNNPSSQPFLQVRFVVLKLVGFGVVIMVGFIPTKAQVGDITVKITHNGCVSRVRVWVRSQDGASG
jgi:hypothetical protein